MHPLSSGRMALSTVHGFPRIGLGRELKFGTEEYWAGERDADELAATAREIRIAPNGDFFVAERAGFSSPKSTPKRAGC